MNRNANFFKLGLFVISAFALCAIFLVIFGAGTFFKKELLAETCFNESVQGLSVGSEVKYKGIQIGTVKSITSAAQMYQTKSDYVLVTIALQQDISMGQTGETAARRMQKAIDDGLTIRLSFKGLTGAAYLETDYDETTPQNSLDISWTPTNLYIPSKQSNMKQFGDAINQILENLSAINLKGITLNIGSLLKTLDDKINQVDLKELSDLASSVMTSLDSTGRRISTVLEDKRIDRVLSDAEESFKGIRQIVSTAQPTLKTALIDLSTAAGSTRDITTQVRDTLNPKMSKLSGNLDLLVQNLGTISTQLENMVWLNSDKIDNIVENLQTTSENLKQMSKDIKQYPGRLLFQSPPASEAAREVEK